MADFYPGDKIAFVNDRLTGSVVRRLDKSKVLVALDDGFEIPVDVRELVLVSKSEKAPDRVREQPEAVLAETMEKVEGYGLALITEEVKLGKAEVKAFMVNTTQHTLLFTAYVQQGNTWKALARGDLEQSEAMPVAQFYIDQADDYRQWLISLMPYSRSGSKPQPPWSLDLKIKPVTLLKEKTVVPVLRREGVWLPLQSPEEAAAPALPKLDAAPEMFAQVEQTGAVVDLHISEVAPQAQGLLPDAILQIQLRHFQNALDKAVAFRMEKLTFIHGIGNGRLKTEIRKALNIHPDVVRYEEAEPKKFGYGATAVYLKVR